MSESSLRLVNEHDLETDLSEFGGSLVREIYLAARKLEGADVEFAAVQKLLDRPLSHLRKWFRLLRVADLEVAGDGLRLFGFPLPDTAFTSGLGGLLRERGVERLVIVPPVATPELQAFLRALTSPPADGTLADKVRARGVRCILVNDPEWRSLFEHRPAPNAEPDGKVPLQKYVMEQWSKFPDLVCAAAAGGLPDSSSLGKWHCYVTPQTVEAVLSSHFVSLPASAILEHVRTQLEIGETTGEAASRPPATYWQGLLAAVADHPYGYELARAIKEILSKEELPVDVDELLDSSVLARFKATAAVDELTARIFSTSCTVDDLKNWGTVFARLLKSDSSQRTASFLEALLLHLKRDDREARRKAHFLLGRALAAAAATENAAVVRWLSERLVADLVSGAETYEFSDLLAGAGEMLAGCGEWEVLANLATRLKALESNGVAPGRERTIQVVLERWRQPRWVARLFKTAIEPQRGADAVALLAALGGRDVAQQAASLITHSQRRVRLAMLELLSGLGEEAVTICEEMIEPAALWAQRKADGTLFDEAWYRIRNTLHILGRVGQDRALPTLKLHSNDTDARVRLEIIRALERIGSQDAKSMLIALAGDADLEVKKAAVTALGNTGGEHEVFVIQELLRSDVDLAECALLALGHIGGRGAKDFLFMLLDGATAGLPRGLSRDLDVREVAMRALAANPDSEIVTRIETFCRNTHRTFRIPLVTDSLSESSRTRFEKTRSSVKKR